MNPCKVDWRLLVWLLFLGLVAAYYIGDKLDTMLICWRADTLNLELAPPVYHQEQVPGRRS